MASRIPIGVAASIRAYSAGAEICLRPASLSVPGAPGLGILTGKKDLYDSDLDGSVNPGGVPIFKNGRVLPGGLAWWRLPRPANYNAVVEYAAVVGNGRERVRSGGAVPRRGGCRGSHASFCEPDDPARRGLRAGKCRMGVMRLAQSAGSGAAPEGDLIQEHGSNSSKRADAGAGATDRSKTRWRRGR